MNPPLTRKAGGYKFTPARIATAKTPPEYAFPHKPQCAVNIRHLESELLGFRPTPPASPSPPLAPSDANPHLPLLPAPTARGTASEIPKASHALPNIMRFAWQGQWLHVIVTRSNINRGATHTAGPMVVSQRGLSPNGLSQGGCGRSEVDDGDVDDGGDGDGDGEGDDDDGNGDG